MTGAQRVWVFRLTSARQRFICETFDAPLERVPTLGASWLRTIDDPVDQFESSILNGALLELAARWGAHRHDALRAMCPLKVCAPATLAAIGGYWNTQPLDPKNAFLAWLGDFCRELSATHGDPLARRVAALIRETPSARLKAIASRVAAHEATIRRAIKREYHMTPREYQKQVRVELAEDLLRAAPMEKTETVGAAVGWKHRKDLCRAVHQVRGCTPGALRAQRRTES